MRGVFFWLLLWPALLLAHPGGLDAQGGHRDARSGQYHCHREGCRLPAAEAMAAAVAEAAAEGRAFVRLYRRADWPHWTDADGNCRDTRAEVLIAHSRVPVAFRDAAGCTVAAGEWLDPYSGALLRQAGDIDIDHLVPLKHAHGHGGDGWPPARRQAFANDPDNLLPVSAAQNRAKGASSPDQWLPPNRAYWCEYGQRWQAVKARYELLITPPEAAALEQLAQTCAEVAGAF